MGKHTDVERALNLYFDLLHYTYVSYPGGPKVVPPVTSLNYQVECVYEPSVAATVSVDAATRCAGTYVVTIRAPETGEGTYAILTAAETIATHFKRGAVVRYPGLVVLYSGLAPSPLRAPSATLAPSKYTENDIRTRAFCRTPTIRHLGNVTPEWYSVEVRVPWYTDI